MLSPGHPFGLVHQDGHARLDEMLLVQQDLLGPHCAGPIISL